MIAGSGFIVIKGLWFKVKETANRRTAEYRISNFEGWYRFALAYKKKNV